MSGVEVIGLVLGGLPLLISAFEHLRDFRDSKDWVLHFRTKFAAALDEVKDEQMIFELHLKKLLLPLIATDALRPDELHALLLEPGGPGWKDGEVGKALERRLGDVHKRYMEVLGEIPEIIHRLLLMLGFKLAGDGRSLQDKLQAEEESGQTAKSRLKIKANLSFVTRRADLVLTKFTREDLLTELREKIEKLDNFLRLGDEVVTLEQQNVLVIPQKAIKTLLQHWTHANRHQANPVFELKLLVLYCPPAVFAPADQRWQPQGLQIRYFEGDVSESAGLSSSPIVAARSQQKQRAVAPPLRSALARTSKLGGIRKQVSSVVTNTSFTASLSRRTGNPPIAQIAETSEQGTELVGSQSRKVGEASATPSVGGIVKRVKINVPDAATISATMSLQEIHNLCESLAGLRMECTGVGLLIDHDNNKRYQVISEPRQKIVASEITLWDALQPSHRPRVAIDTRIHLALKISSSHLKLQSTPWVRNQWQARDICFPRLEQHNRILFEDPYISVDFRDEDEESGSAHMKYRSFVSLGIMLLELVFGKTLESHDYWEQLKLPDKNDLRKRQHVAVIWALDITERMPGETGRLFNEAVKWCLSDSPYTLQGDEWRKELADRVVLTLEKCCSWMQQGMPSS